MITWDDAQELCQGFSGDTSATMLTNFKRLMNIGYKEVLHSFDGEETEDVRTTATQTSTRAIKLAPNYIRMHSVTATIGSQVVDLVEEESQDMWNQRLYMNRTGDRPEVYYLRPRQGIGGTELLLDPIPSGTSTIITITYAANARALAVNAYTTGSIAVTNDSTTITGTGTTFTAAMVGRYFKVDDETGDGNWYRITGYTSATSLTIENKYDGSTVSGKNYFIAEAFALPEDLHMAPIYYAMWHYYIGYRADKDEKRGAIWESKYRAQKQLADARYKRKGKNTIIREKHRMGGWPVYPGHFPESAS